MSLDLNLSVRAKPAFLVGIFLGIVSVSFSGWAWAGVPYSTSELRSVENSQEAQIHRLRDEEITQLRITLGRRSPTHRQADLYFRLAEIYLEAYHSVFLLEGRVHEKRLASGMRDPLIDRNHSRPFLVAGIKACKEVIGFRIPYEKLDQIYYFLGFYYGELEDRKESANYYKYLVDHYPNSTFAGVAYKELAGYSFKNNEFRKSLEFYERALEKTPADQHPPILHKLAWSYYRIKEYERAIETMKQAIASCNDFGDKFLPLKEEAMEDMAVLMTERGHVEEAIQYFESAAGDQSFFPRVLEKLGKQYERNLQFPQATTVYETLLRTHPKSSEAMRVFEKLVELDLKQKRYSNVIARLRNFELPEGGNDETRAAVQNIRVTIRKTAIEHHQIYRKKNSRADLEIAELFYTTYLNYFLKKADPHKEIPEIEMYLAEVKKDLGKANEVVELYRQVVKSKDSRYAKQAGQLWMASIVEAMKKMPQRSSDSPSDLERQFVEASDLLLSSLGDAPEAKDIALRAAQVLAGYKATRQDAIQRIQTIISRWPRTQQGITAAKLWIQLALDQKKSNGNQGSEELTAALKEISSNSELMAVDRTMNQGKIKALLEDEATRAEISQIAKEERSQNYASAAKRYEEFAAKATDRNIAEKAYANAMSSYLKLPDSSDAILALVGVWLKRYPKSPKVVESLRTAATNALIRGNFEFSAHLFHLIGVEYREANSLSTAAQIEQGIGDEGGAQQEWTHYLENFPNSPDRWSTTLALARSQERTHLDGDAAKSYRNCAGGPPIFQAECNSRLADLYLRDQDIERAKSLFKQVSSQGTGKKGEALSPFVGYARFKLADLTQSEANFEPLKFPQAQLQKALTQRLSFLGPLSNAYQSVVQVGGPWAIAALHNLALWATHFAEEVDTIQPPSSVQGEALVKFRKDLASVSTPLREKAKSTWNDAYTKAVSLQLFSPALPSVADALADFKIAIPSRAQGLRGHFQLAGIAPDGGGKEGKIAGYQTVRSKLMANARDASAWIDYGNLLWGDGKPLMAKIAYQRATALNSRNPIALNNLAVVQISSEGEEDWIAVAEGGHYLRQALEVDDFFIPAKANLATLMNYYRMFAKAKLLWNQVLVRTSNQEAQKEAQDGLAIALQGMGNAKAAEAAFNKATEMGADSKRFALQYHRAARSSLQGVDGADQCYDILDGINENQLAGFEKLAVDHLKEKCKVWKQKKD